MESNRLADRRYIAAAIAIVALVVLLFESLATPIFTTYAQPPAQEATDVCEGCCSDPDGCVCSPPACADDCGNITYCDVIPGGDSPPIPTQVWSTPGSGGGGGTPGPGGGGGTPGPGGGGGPSGPYCGDGICQHSTENLWTCPWDCGVATPTPQSGWSDDEVTYHCEQWHDCPDEYADITMVYVPLADMFAIRDIKCLDESECVGPTAEPPEPGGGGHTWPCDYETWHEGGYIRQPCEAWPGWFIEVTNAIPMSAVLMNPWPRCLVGLETRFWIEGADDAALFSEDKALPCPGAEAHGTYDQNTYNCGGEVGTVTEGAKVNYQVGAAWRRWRQGTGTILGDVPPYGQEYAWVVRDRDWNGGEQTFYGEFLRYTFETSSAELDEIGPVWNPACQDEDCSCDERVLEYLGGEAYSVTPLTYWWPEYTFRYDEYVCTHQEWSNCFGRDTAPIGQVTQHCGSSHCAEGVGWCGRVSTCEEWGWRQRTNPLDYCPPGKERGDWCIYDMKELFGRPSSFVPYAHHVVAGANAVGEQCGSFTDKYPCYVPVPCIEVQPEGTGW